MQNELHKISKAKRNSVLPNLIVEQNNVKFELSNSEAFSSTDQLTDLNDNNEIDFKYSWCGLKPKFCKLCQNWIFIFVILNVCVFIQNLVTSGIGTVIVSTMEKEFYLTSTESGIFLGIYDFAAFIASPVVGYFGGLKNVNKMRIISISLLLVAVGAYAIGLTVFAKEADSSIYATTTYELTVCLTKTNKTNLEIECAYNDAKKSYDFEKYVKVILYIANLVIGCGSVALYSVGIAYIEEIVVPEKSSMCQAIFYGVGAIGGGVGILLTGQFLNLNSRFYLESYKKYSNLTTSSSNWIGCWWMPWLCYGLLCNILAIYIFGFPKKVKTPAVPAATNVDDQSKQLEKYNKRRQLNKLNNGEASNATNLSEIQTKNNKNISRWCSKRKTGVSKFLKDFKKIITNAPFICLALASATEGILLKGFLGFISKFFEYQYQISSTNSTIITGVIAVFSVIFGSLCGALIITKLKFNAVKSSLLITIIYLITSFAFWFLVLSCQEDQFVDSSDIVNRTCSNCNCKNVYDPVCYNDNSTIIMYQSACHAGCKTKISSDKYTNCSCLYNSQKKLVSKAQNQTVSFSYCKKDVKCLDIMVAGCCVAFFIVFLTSVALIPHLKAIIGTIDIKIQSFGLGIRTAIIRVIGNFIGPIIFGLALDTTCLYWKTNCYNQMVCKIYNNKQMSFLLASIGFACRFSSFIFCLIAFCILKYRETRDAKLNGVKSVDKVDSNVLNMKNKTEPNKILPSESSVFENLSVETDYSRVNSYNSFYVNSTFILDDKLNLENKSKIEPPSVIEKI